MPRCEYMNYVTLLYLATSFIRRPGEHSSHRRGGVPPGHPLEPPLTATCCIRVRCTKGLLQLQAVIVYRRHDACIVAGRLWAVPCHPGGVARCQTGPSRPVWAGPSVRVHYRPTSY